MKVIDAEKFIDEIKNINPLDPVTKPVYNQSNKELRYVTIGRKPHQITKEDIIDAVEKSIVEI